MGKQTIPDEEIVPLILAGWTNYKICKYFGLQPGYLQGPIKRLREDLSVPSPGRRLQTLPEPESAPKKNKYEEGVITYHMSPEEIRERYGPPGLTAKKNCLGETQADDYLIEKATELKEEGRRKERKRK